MYLKSLIHNNHESDFKTFDSFRKIATLSPYIIFIHKASDQSLLFINKRVTDLLGYTEEDIINKGGNLLEVLFNQNDKDFIVNLKTTYKDESDILEFKAWVKHKNGGKRIFKIRTMIYKRNEIGEIEEILGIAEDITEEYQSLEKIKRNETLLSETEKTLKYGSWYWNVPTGEITWSAGLLKIFGYESTENNQLDFNFFVDHIHPDDKEQVLKSAENFLKTGINDNNDYRIITKAGEIKILNGKSNIIEGTNQNPIKVIGSTADVTEIRKFHEKLIENEALLAEAEKILEYGSWIYDIETKKVDCSDGLWRTFGYEPQSFELDLEKYLSLIDIRDVENVKNVIDNALKNQESYNIEHRLIKPNGEERIISGKGRPVFDKNNKLIKLLGSTADVTQLRIAQQELENKVIALNRSNIELEQFAYVASHDLQEPLRKIIAFGERLDIKFGNILGDDGKLYLTRMISASLRMKLLIENLLNFSTITKHNADFKPTDLNDILKSALSDLDIKIEEKNAVINFENLPVIEAISSQINQLFLNLISNALKFNKTNQNIVIDVKHEMVSHLLKIDLGLESTKDYIKIDIVDNGIGFNQEYAEKIFIIFQRLQGRSEEGSGIGLAICKKIIENHSGKIFATSTVGIGSTFTVILPLKQLQFKTP